VDEKKPERGNVRIWMDFEGNSMDEEVKEMANVGIDLSINNEYGKCPVHVTVDEIRAILAKVEKETGVPLILTDSMPPKEKPEVTPEKTFGGHFVGFTGTLPGVLSRTKKEET